MVLKSPNDSNGLVLDVSCRIPAYEHVVHVDVKPSFADHISKDVVHHSLERSWGVAQSEEHYCWFEQSFVCFERCFSLVAVFNAYVVVFRAYVHLGEPGISFDLVD